jgi:hypothetical protein
MFTKDDLLQIRERGSNPENIEKQIERFKTGFPFTELVAPATLSRGIISLNDSEKRELATFYNRNSAGLDICRFVPASGAATRMFKSLFTLHDTLKGMSEQEQREHVDSDAESRTFFASLDHYPFHDDLNLKGTESPIEVLDRILFEKGLNYGLLPKGLLKFHNYNGYSRTAFEEHLHEAARMSASGREVKLHFTVSGEHFDGFKSLEASLKERLKQQYGSTFRITYSFQKKETDTIAVDLSNHPFRDEAGKLVFRPGGHGALLENLNDLGHDIIFVNNIDNVSPDRSSELRILHKKVLGGMVIRLKQEAGELLNLLHTGDEKALAAAEKWLRGTAFREIPVGFTGWERKKKSDWLMLQLDRPVRVCGMVKNEGEPGGGPFFTRNSEGVVSLQIVESSQVDTGDNAQAEIFERSTHFNPVDLACSIKNAKGESYDLRQFIDSNTGFISEKSVRGKELKALELPGLWNGSMAGWITIFVEVPAETFTPVKTIFDLVRQEHRG